MATRKDKRHKKDVDPIEKVQNRELALFQLAELYRDFLIQWEYQFEGAFTEHQVAELAQLKATYIANDTDHVDEHGIDSRPDATYLFDNPIPLRKPYTGQRKRL